MVFWLLSPPVLRLLPPSMPLSAKHWEGYQLSIFKRWALFLSSDWAHNFASSTLAGQPENGWPLKGKYCIVPSPSRNSGLHIQVPYNYENSISQWTRWAGGRHTTPARSPSVGDTPSRAIDLPETMFAALGVISAGHLGPNTYHSSPKAVNIPPG